MEKKVLNTENQILGSDLRISMGPHIKDTNTTTKLMLDVIIALIPAIIGSVYFFKLKAVILLLTCVLSCVVFEGLTQKVLKKPIRIKDLSAVVTGILLAFNLPADAPVWMAVFGSACAIILIKECFGGIGFNFINPALGARAMLMASWPRIMGTYVSPDGLSGPTPLQLIKAGTEAKLPPIFDMAMGNIGGVIGETSAILLAIGGLYLIIRKVIDWETPVIYIATTAILLPLLGVDISLMPYEILGGGLFLGAIFMATDYATSPMTKQGKIVFALGCGILTALIRTKGQMPEGVSYAILLMNVFTPTIDKFMKSRVFGEVKVKK
ncbi:MAG: RnfABCDGE type electron transport complex subunit D [Tissierellia bacterium]|nr:RnfABCDGE type electron transport complex subunit D [Tissierellia bacterium]